MRPDSAVTRVTAVVAERAVAVQHIHNGCGEITTVSNVSRNQCVSGRTLAP